MKAKKSIRVDLLARVEGEGGVTSHFKATRSARFVSRCMSRPAFRSLFAWPPIHRSRPPCRWPGQGPKQLWVLAAPKRPAVFSGTAYIITAVNFIKKPNPFSMSSIFLFDL